MMHSLLYQTNRQLQVDDRKPEQLLYSIHDTQYKIGCYQQVWGLASRVKTMVIYYVQPNYDEAESLLFHYFFFLYGRGIISALYV